MISHKGRGFKSGELGPSTIVGSASFNLFVITAICIISIPKKNEGNNESGVRRIKAIKVGTWGVARLGIMLD